jgi:eukaryotic translation initiation factor 2C
MQDSRRRAVLCVQSVLLPPRAVPDADGCVEYPNLPLRYADNGLVVDISTKRREILVPAELCDIVAGTAYMGKLDGDETAQMIRHACKDPTTNATAIVSIGLPQLGLAPADAPQGSFAAFGITVSSDMTAFITRVLPPPTLSYKAGGRPNAKVCCPLCSLSWIGVLTDVIQDGGWNILDVKFYKAATPAPKWAVMVVRDGPPRRFPLQGGPTDPQLTEFTQGFKAKLIKGRLSVPTDPAVFFTEQLPGPNADADHFQSLKMIRAALVKNLDRNRKPSFVLVLLATEDNCIYPGVKRLGDVELGVNTVCMLILPRKALVPDVQKRDQYYSNVALKVHSLLPSFILTSS